LTALFTINTSACTTDKVYLILKNRRPVQALFPHIVHVGFLIAVLGHLVGSVWGFKAPGNILYKDAVVPVPETPGLSIRLEEFEVRQSGNNPPDMLRSRVTLIEDGKEIKTGDIEINSPLFHKGIAFYHVNQGSTPTGLVLESGGEFREVDFYSGFSFGEAKRYALGEIFPDFALRADGMPTSRSAQYNNPYVTLLSPDGSASYLSVGYPGSMATVRSPDGSELIVRLVDYKMSEFVVLNINKDPGIWLIISGSAVLVVGMFLLLFFRGQRSEIVRTNGYA
jgi:cytochrome c biogenesis protein ResB